MTIHDHIIEHLHELLGEWQTREIWWGAAVLPTEKNALARTASNPFVVTSGNNTWGPAILVVGSRDDPAPKGTSTFHIHRITVEGHSSNTTWLLRFLYGKESLEEAAQASRWTEALVIATATHPLAAAGAPVDLRFPELASRRYKVWCQAWNGTNLATIEFYVGCHGHDPVHKFE